MSYIQKVQTDGTREYGVWTMAPTFLVKFDILIDLKYILCKYKYKQG